MRTPKILIILLTFLNINTYAQDAKQYYTDAFNEQLAMLQGKKPIDFKRAVFVTENSYYKGSLNYQDYCTDINKIGLRLILLIHNRGYEKYKTAGNWAAFMYMADSSILNYFKPYRYNFDDFYGDKDWTNQFVTKLMKTHGGNCHSLPYLYKILCDEIGANASLALAPNHVYIKHIDENGQWTNVEMTSGSFPRDQWVIKSMSISVEAIKSGAYMAPLSDSESIALCMFDLAETYNFQYGQDEFLLKIIDTALNYYPNCIDLYQLKANACLRLAEKERRKPIPDLKFIDDKMDLYKTSQVKINELGYTDEPPEAYQAFLKGMDNEKRRRGLIKNN
jgi:hypothetical protein